jgi:hypothetical protein
MKQRQQRYCCSFFTHALLLLLPSTHFITDAMGKSWPFYKTKHGGEVCSLRSDKEP